MTTQNVDRDDVVRVEYDLYISKASKLCTAFLGTSEV